MNSFLQSNKIKVFPCSNRNPEKDSTSRLMTEYNISSLINRFVDQKSFVVYSEEAKGTDFHFGLDFNINGYYFRIDDFRDVIGETDWTKQVYTNNTTYLYAGIKIVKGAIFTELASTKSITKIFTETKSSAIDQSVIGSIDDGSFYGITFQLKNNMEEPGSWNTPQNSGITNILPLLKIVVNSNKVVTSVSIPEESYVKFKTDNIYRSVLIDDGRLN